MGTFVTVDLETVPLPDAAEYLDVETIQAPSNYKDEAKIAAYIASAQASRVAKCSFDPDLCRVAAIGWMFAGESEPTVIACPDEHIERLALEQFWRAMAPVTPLEPMPKIVTFNGFRFDLPVVMRRSDYLGVRYIPINLDKYRSGHIDLAHLLTFGGITGITHGLRFYAKRFKVPVQYPEVDGGDVAALASAGEWDSIVAHCGDDIQVTHGIAIKCGVFSKPLSYVRH